MKNPQPNRSKRVQKAMQEIEKKNNADKDSAVVIIYLEKDINEANRQLSDKHNYKTLHKDPKLQFVNNITGRFKKENSR